LDGQGADIRGAVAAGIGRQDSPGNLGVHSTESKMVILLPSNLTTQPSVLSTRFPSFVNLKQSNDVILTDTSSQTSSPPAVNEIGASGGTISRALHEILGAVVSTIDAVVLQVVELPEASVAV